MQEWITDAEACVAISVKHPEIGSYLYGPPGTGKSRFALEYLEAHSGKEPVVMPGFPSATGGDVWGYYLPGESGSKWVDGFGTRAWREGRPLLIEELGLLVGSDAEGALLACLTDPRIARVTLPTGETLRPAEGFAVVATGNMEPKGLAEALRNRFALSVFANRPTVAAMKALTDSAIHRAVFSAYSGAAGVTPWVTYRQGMAYQTAREHGMASADAARVALGDAADTFLAQYGG